MALQLDLFRSIDELPTFLLGKKIIALSWKQPFCSLMLQGKAETRKWPTTYRGWVLICSSKKPYTREEVMEISGTKQLLRIDTILRNEPTAELNGYAIAIGKISNCEPMHHNDEDICFLKHNPMLYKHVYVDITRIKPFPWSGQQKWKSLTFDDYKAIEVIQDKEPQSL